MKKLGLMALTASALLLNGCGGGSSDSEQQLTAKNILLGKVLYSADADLDEPTGYYRDIFGENALIESEHAEDGTQLYPSIQLSLTYNADQITVSLGGISDTCTVKSVNKGVQFTCDNPQETFMEWYSIADIVR